MNALATAAAACSGVYVYVALYYSALYVLRREREHLLFAGLCASLACYALATGLSIDAPDPAHAARAQHLQFAGLFGASGCFVAFVLRFAEVAAPRVVRASWTLSLAGMGAAASRLFVDPGFANPSYDWAVASAGDPATAALTPVGLAFTAMALVFCGYAVARLFRRAADKPELRVAAFGTVIGMISGVADVARSVLELAPYSLSAHLSLVAVLGFSYVLIGRFTRVDAQLAVRTEELAHSYDHLRLAQEELVKKEQLAAVGELSAVIAHEVKNPLAIIKNAVGGLRRRELPPEDADTLLTILDEETDRLNRLVNDLLAYAKPISPEAGEVDVCKLVGHAVELAAGGNQDISQIEIELDLGSDVDKVEGDEALLRHALINIVDNALQAMPTGGTLTITCRNTELYGRPAVAVDFHDTGEGMDTMVRSKARDPFFTTRQTGTGLGLAIVDRVARVHGGAVEIESRHGQGTTVSFVVPRERSATTPASS